MEVHEKIKFIRLFRGWSQEEMAEKLGMVLNGYTKIEQGKVDINLSRLKQIAETLGVEVAQLVGLSEKNIFNFIENGSIHQQQQFHSNTVVQSDCQYELEKARLVIEQKEQEILYLKEIITLMKKSQEI